MYSFAVPSAVCTPSFTFLDSLFPAGGSGANNGLFGACDGVTRPGGCLVDLSRDVRCLFLFRLLGGAVLRLVHLHPPRLCPYPRCGIRNFLDTLPENRR